MARPQNVDMFLMKQKLYEKMTKQALACKYYAHTYNVEIFISFNPELQLNNAEFIIKNKLKHWLNEMRGF